MHNPVQLVRQSGCERGEGTLDPSSPSPSPFKLKNLFAVMQERNGGRGLLSPKPHHSGNEELGALEVMPGPVGSGRPVYVGHDA